MAKASAPPPARPPARFAPCSELARQVQTHAARAVEGLGPITPLRIARQRAFARQLDAVKIVEIQIPPGQQLAPLRTRAQPPDVGGRGPRVARRADEGAHAEVPAHAIAVIED